MGQLSTGHSRDVVPSKKLTRCHAHGSHADVVSCRLMVCASASEEAALKLCTQEARSCKSLAMSVLHNLGTSANSKGNSHYAQHGPWCTECSHVPVASLFVTTTIRLRVHTH